MFKVMYDKMREIYSELNQDLNKVFCGYLRQPIYADKCDTGYFIEGTCSKTGKRCLKLKEKKEVLI